MSPADPSPQASHRKPRDTRERQRRERYGRWAEYVAAAALIVKGYRLLGRRVKTPLGEIDLIAVRGRRLAFVEVKLRQSVAGAEAAVSERQRERVRAAAECWLARRPRYQAHDQAFDLIFILPRAWPRHIENGL